MSQDPGSWIDRIVGWCFSILIASFLLYCAVQLVQSVLPALIIVGGIIGLVALLVGAIVVIRTWRNRF